MKKKFIPALIVGILLLFSSSINAQFQWAQKIGGGTYDKGKKIINGTNGSVYVIGEFAGNPDFDAGTGTYNCTPSSGCYILKLDSGGNFLWAKSYGGYSTDGISKDASGNILISGFFYNTVDFDPGSGVFNLTAINGSSVPNLYVMKLDSSGNFVWAVRYGNSSTDAKAIANDASGNVFITGFYSGVIDFDPGSGVSNMGTANVVSGYVLKLDAGGNFGWVKEMRNISQGTSATGTALQVDGLGNIIITGSFNGNVDFNPGTAVDTIRAGGNLFDIFVLKLDGSGNFVWVRAVGNSTTIDLPFGLAVDASNNIYSTGNFGNAVDFDPGAGTATLTATGTSDAYVWKLDASGNYMWAKNIGDNSWAIALDGSGNVYTLGYSGTACDLDPGAGTYNLAAVSGYILKLDPGGNFQWARGYFLATSLNDICVNGVDVYFTGRFNGTIDFDPDAPVYNLAGGIYYAIVISKLRSYSTSSVVENSSANLSSKVFPNPTSGNLYVSLQKQYSGAVEVLDYTGKLIHSEIVKDVSEIQLNLSEQKDGIYFIKINGRCLKVILEK